MRHLTLASVFVFLATASSAFAQGRTAPDPQLPKTQISTPYAPKESTALANEARERAEALERDRDRRMKSITRGICSGC